MSLVIKQQYGLPNEIWSAIFQYNDASTLKLCRGVCCQWRCVLSDSFFWKNYFENHGYPPCPLDISAIDLAAAWQSGAVYKNKDGIQGPIITFEVVASRVVMVAERHIHSWIPGSLLERVTRIESNYSCIAPFSDERMVGASPHEVRLFNADRTSSLLYRRLPQERFNPRDFGDVCELPSGNIILIDRGGTLHGFSALGEKLFVNESISSNDPNRCLELRPYSEGVFAVREGLFTPEAYYLFSEDGTYFNLRQEKLTHLSGQYLALEDQTIGVYEAGAFRQLYQATTQITCLKALSKGKVGIGYANGITEIRSQTYEVETTLRGIDEVYSITYLGKNGWIITYRKNRTHIKNASHFSSEGTMVQQWPRLALYEQLEGGMVVATKRQDHVACAVTYFPYNGLSVELAGVKSTNLNDPKESNHLIFAKYSSYEGTLLQFNIGIWSIRTGSLLKSISPVQGVLSDFKVFPNGDLLILTKSDEKKELKYYPLIPIPTEEPSV